MPAASSETPQPVPASVTPYHRGVGGRPPKNSKLPQSTAPEAPDPKRLSMLARDNGEAGRIALEWNHFLWSSVAGWGSSLDMFPLAHGAVGCGAFALTERLNLPGFTQGIDSFTALHACTNITADDLEDNGDNKLERAIDEARELFSLVQGITILNEEPIALMGGNIQGIVKAKAKETGQFIAASSYGFGLTTRLARGAAFKAAALRKKYGKVSRYNVALTYERRAAGLVWIVSKLLSEIGLNPVHEFTGTSSSDLARIGTCNLIIGLYQWQDVPVNRMQGAPAPELYRLTGIQMVWTCFVGPSATDISLRAIAAHFDETIQRRAEKVIAANRKKLEAAIAIYRPRLEGKLFLNLSFLVEEQLEPFRLLGMRVGNGDGWPGKTGVRRTPRLAMKWGDEKSLSSYIEEAKPDLVFLYSCDEYDWHKRGLPALPFSPLFDRHFMAFWGYDGFLHLAEALDRHLNTPWRKLLKPPWPENSS